MKERVMGRIPGFMASVTILYLPFSCTWLKEKGGGRTISFCYDKFNLQRCQE